ncbi:MAG TPA: hypothetical protein VKT78_16125 [Fimbriimonadaceae bacterium]|nr:hypothetical protein [Fimbriimonadaceae bacterium]
MADDRWELRLQKGDGSYAALEREVDRELVGRHPNSLRCEQAMKGFGALGPWAEGTKVVYWRNCGGA